MSANACARAPGVRLRLRLWCVCVRALGRALWRRRLTVNHLVLDARGSFPSGVVVDVYVVHLSLSEQARNRGVVEMWDFIERTSVGDVRVRCRRMCTS